MKGWVGVWMKGWVGCWSAVGEGRNEGREAACKLLTVLSLVL